MHYKTVCSECEVVIEECKCPGKDKSVIKELCDACAKKKKEISEDETLYWTCDECKSGDTAHCVRPEHCHASIQAKVHKADSMLDDMRERGLI